MIGEYLFGTAEAEIMEIIDGHVEVRLKGESEWKSYKSGSFLKFQQTQVLI